MTAFCEKQLTLFDEQSLIRLGPLILPKLLREAKLEDLIQEGVVCVVGCPDYQGIHVQALGNVGIGLGKKIN